MQKTPFCIRRRRRPSTAHSSSFPPLMHQEREALKEGERGSIRSKGWREEAAAKSCQVQPEGGWLSSLAPESEYASFVISLWRKLSLILQSFGQLILSAAKEKVRVCAAKWMEKKKKGDRVMERSFMTRGYCSVRIHPRTIKFASGTILQSRVNSLCLPFLFHPLRPRPLVPPPLLLLLSISLSPSRRCITTATTTTIVQEEHHLGGKVYN